MKRDFRQDLAERRMQRVRVYLRLKLQEVARLRRLIKKMPDITTGKLVEYALVGRSIEDLKRAGRNATKVGRHIDQHNCLTARFKGPRTATGNPLRDPNRATRPHTCPVLSRQAIPPKPFRPRLV